MTEGLGPARGRTIDALRFLGIYSDSDLLGGYGQAWLSFFNFEAFARAGTADDLAALCDASDEAEARGIFGGTTLPAPKR